MEEKIKKPFNIWKWIVIVIGGFYLVTILFLLFVRNVYLAGA